MLVQSIQNTERVNNKTLLKTNQTKEIKFGSANIWYPSRKFKDIFPSPQLLISADTDFGSKCITLSNGNKIQDLVENLVQFKNKNLCFVPEVGILTKMVNSYKEDVLKYLPEIKKLWLATIGNKALREELEMRFNIKNPDVYVESLEGIIENGQYKYYSGNNALSVMPCLK